MVLCCAADDEGCCSSGVVFLPEYGNAITAYFEGFDYVYGAHFVGHGGAEAGEWCSADDAAEAAEFEFREDFDDEDIIAVEVVEG